MDIRPAERLVLVMLSEIYEKLGCDGVNPAFVREAIYTGHYWALEWEYPGIFEPEPTDVRVVKEVCDILDMWNFIEEAGGDKFPGFDGNREGAHASVARMMTDKMGRFVRFKGRTGNGVLGLDGFRRMCRKFEDMRPDLADRQLSKEEIESLLAERIHPDRR